MSSKQSGLQVLEELLHAARLELEDARRLARLQQLVGRLVVERDRVDVEAACPCDRAAR